MPPLRPDDGWGPAPGDLARLRERCAHLLQRTPRATPSHWTAAALHGLPVPAGTLDLLHVTVPHGRNAPRRAGVVGHRAVRVERQVLAGLPLTPVERTWLDLARAGATREELLVVGDAAWRRGLVEPEHLAQRLAERPGGHGAVRARWAVERTDRRAAGVDESRLRALLLEGGVRPPALGHEVVHDDGTVLATFALAWPAWRVGVRLVRLPLVQQWAQQVVHDTWLRLGGLRAWQVVDVPDVMLHRRGDVLRQVRAALRLGRAAASALGRAGEEGSRTLWSPAG